MSKRRTIIVIIVATCVFGYLTIQSIYSLAITVMTPSFFPESFTDFYFDVVSNVIDIMVSVFVVLGIWRRHNWTRMLLAAYTLIVTFEVFCLPIFMASIDYDADYLGAMAIFVGPIILFNIYFIKSKGIEQYFKNAPK